MARGLMKMARGALQKETVGAVPRGRVVTGAVTAGGGRRVGEVEKGEKEEKNRGEDEK